MRRVKNIGLNHFEENKIFLTEEILMSLIDKEEVSVTGTIHGRKGFMTLKWENDDTLFRHSIK